ncbi:MAG: hypothetical protein SGJ27_27820 [Candidatus Melainabacteria bacterium]|nr:hypothetical protein [Candidatus Melainabacteria bacterium]
MHSLNENVRRIKGNQLRAGITQENNDEANLTQARTLLAEGHIDASMAVLKTYWLTHPNDCEAVELCANLMDQANRAESAHSLTRLKEALEAKEDEESQIDRVPEAAFEAGYHLIDSRNYELAIMLLSACLATQPFDSTLNYELGFALMATSKYDDAVDHFKIARKEDNDFDTTLNISVCHALSRKIKEAKESVTELRKLASTEEEKHELHHREIVIKRLEKLQKKKLLNDRDWLYALYGTIHLQPTDSTTGATSTAGAFSLSPSTSPLTSASNTPVPANESFRSIASTLVILKGVLEGLSLAPEAVEFYNPNSRPLAAVLARLFDTQLDNYKGPDRPDRALLVMDWATDIIGPHHVFVGNMPNRSIFAYGITKTEALPVVPDIVAKFTNNLNLPWTERDGQVPDITPEDAIPQILDVAWNLESDPEILRAIQAAVEYYEEKRAFLVIGNCAQFPQRGEYSAEVPNSR